MEHIHLELVNFFLTNQNGCWNDKAGFYLMNGIAFLMLYVIGSKTLTPQMIEPGTYRMKNDVLG